MREGKTQPVENQETSKGALTKDGLTSRVPDFRSPPGALRLRVDSQLQPAWVDFIKSLDRKVHFDWFTTLTFRVETHPESGLKARRRWEHIINRLVYGVRYTSRKQGISSVIAIEYQKRGVIHLHSLDGGTTVPLGREIQPHHEKNFYVRADGRMEFKRMKAIEQWFDLAGIARIYPFRREGGAEAYVSKYVSKGGDIFLCGHFEPERQLMLPRLRQSRDLVERRS